MYIAVLAILAVVSFQGAYTAPHEALDESNIVGGYVVKKGQVPFQVSIRSKSSFTSSKGHFCGGSILDNKHIITAAHCARIMSDLSRFYIATSSISLSDEKQIKKYEIKSIKIHEKYGSYSNDVAIIKLTKNIKFNRYTKPIKLPRSIPREGTTCLVSGWGKWSMSDYQIHDELKAAKVPISNMNECIANYSSTGRVDPKTMICAGFKQGGVDSCQGDSGGPLVCNKALAGIVSWGRGCALAGYPGVYTNVHTYIKWLKKNKIAFTYDDEGDINDFDDDNEEVNEEDEDEQDEPFEENDELNNDNAEINQFENLYNDSPLGWFNKELPGFNF